MFHVQQVDQLDQHRPANMSAEEPLKKNVDDELPEKAFRGYPRHYSQGILEGKAIELSIVFQLADWLVLVVFQEMNLILKWFRGLFVPGQVKVPFLG